MPSQELTQAILALISAENDSEKKRVLDTHADLLLTDAADELLVDWFSQSKGNAQYSLLLEECRALLRRQTTQKPLMPSQELMQATLALIGTENDAQSKRVIKEHADLLLTDEAEQLLADWLEQPKGNDQYTRILQERRTLLAHYRHEATSHKSPSGPREKVRQVVREFVDAKEWEKRKQIVESQRDYLLTDAADQLLADLQEQERDKAKVARIIQLRALLARCRRDGIEPAFAKRLRPPTPELLTRLMGVRSKEESIQLLIEHPELVPLLQRAAQSNPASGAIPNELDALIIELLGPAHLSHMSRREKMCRAALALVERDDQPLLWAWLQTMLGNSYLQNPLGAQGLNYEQAIDHLKQAFKVYTPQVYPKQWAMIQGSLATAYYRRIQGERGENIELAIDHAQQVQKVYTPQAFPNEWAITQNHLGNAYYKRIRGERAENIEQAIEHYQLALKVHTRQAFPEQWAIIQISLGNAYTDRIRGKKADNIEKALGHYQQALSVYTRESDPDQWATIHNNMSDAYQKRIYGKEAYNLEQAIYCCEQALQVYDTPDAFPDQWAETHSNLAAFYAQRREKEERAENIKKAIYHNKKALEVYTREAFPAQWAKVHNNLGNVYSEHKLRDRADNIEKAINHFKQALQVITPQTNGMDWAQVQSNFGYAYIHRVRGEQALNIEHAIGHFKQALQVYTDSSFTEQWALTQQLLAFAYKDRIRGEQALNIEQAIHHAKQALERFKIYGFKKKYWAATHQSLAACYRNRVKGEKADNIEQAVNHGQQALSVYTRQEYREEWALTHSDLMIPYIERIQGEGGDNLRKAIQHGQQALKVYTRQAYPVDWAKTQHHLALAYTGYISFLPQEQRVLGLKHAISHYQQALSILKPTAFPEKCRRTAYVLGYLLYAEERFAEARQALVTAHQAVEALRGEVLREGGKKKLASENADLYARLVFCCLHDANADEKAAFEYAAAGKGRAFVDTLASGGFNILTAIDSNPTLANDSLLQQYRSLIQEIDNLRLTLNSDYVSSDDKKRLRPELEARQSKYDTLWEDLTFKYPNLTATVTAPSLTAAQAMTLAADLQATLIEYVQHTGGWSAFVVTQDTIEHVPLEQVDDKLLNGCAKWIKNLESKKAVFFRPKITRKWLTQLYTAFIAPLQKQLPPAAQGKRLVIAPFGALHQLPLNAAQNPDTLAYLSQAYTLTFTPSLAALRAKRSGAYPANWHLNQPQHPLHVAYSGLPGMRDRLQKSSESAVEMAKIFPDVKQLSEKEATPDAVAEQVVNRDLIHFYCHGYFSLDNPNQSGLLLADGFLTVQRIITDLDLTHTHLVALAACQTGRVGVTQGEELVGLIQALLTSGSKAVVATLWKVAEPPTQAFFQHFYRAIKDGHLPAEALTLATQAIRQTKGWEHPYNWAAFQVSGLGFSH